MAISIIGLILFAASIVFFFLNLKKFKKDKSLDGSTRKIEGKTLIILISTVAVGALSLMLAAIGLVISNSWALKGFEWFLTIFGSFLFGLSIIVFIGSFYLYYYCLDLDKKQRKYCRFTMIFAGIAAILGLWLFTEGIGNQDIYPLPNRIDFANGLITSTEPNKFEGELGFGVQIYGIAIVGGAMICYFITDHYCYKEYGEHGLIDALFLVAFLSGIIGARLWFCLVLRPDVYLQEPIRILYIFEGGLAIQGGLFVGITVGIIFVLVFRKYMDLRFIIDVAVPTILIAQAIGRWGNFLNQEVYGNYAPEWMMCLTPTIIKNNMYFYGAQQSPLFFIESVVNLCGFFFIRYFLGKVCKFGMGRGYQGAAYLVWYGLVRVFMEPLRDSKFGFNQSWITAMVMTGIGVISFVVLFFIHKKRFELGLEDENGRKIKKA